MLYLITYDISNDKRRNEIADILKGYGSRVQYSVFECKMNKEKIKEIISELKTKINIKEKDSIRIYQICEADSKKILHFGKTKEELKEIYII